MLTAAARPASTARVSVVIPCRNERGTIADCLDSVLATELPRERLEILVVDGMSDDGTGEVVAGYARRHDAVRVLANPRGTAPAALNIGVAAAGGDVIVRVDAHASYPPDYLPRLLDWMERTGADNVGGVCRTRPANGTRRARAIALGLAHPFGVGNAYFRIGASEPRWVDTVPFGCWRRDLFARIGPFDEELVRNQDDEFNLRLLRRGGRILLVPEIVVDYRARDSLAKLWRMYYQYGYFKPLVARKVGGVMTGRQLVPALFVAGVLGAAAMAPWVPAAGVLLATALGAYAAAALGCAAAAARRHGAGVGAALALVFPVLHVSYGVGSLRGVLDFLVRRRGAPAPVPLSR